MSHCLSQSDILAETSSNLEWLQGYDPRFGITIVDRSDGFKRTAKDSALMLRKVFAFVVATKEKN